MIFYTPKQSAVYFLGVSAPRCFSIFFKRQIDPEHFSKLTFFEILGGIHLLKLSWQTKARFFFRIVYRAWQSVHYH